MNLSRVIHICFALALSLGSTPAARAAEAEPTPVPKTPLIRLKERLKPLPAPRAKSARPAPPTVKFAPRAKGADAHSRRRAAGASKAILNSGEALPPAPGDLVPKGTSVIPIRYNQNFDGDLSDYDYLDGAFWTDRYGFWGYEGDIFTIQMKSGDIDPFVCIFSESSELCDDNSGDGNDAEIYATLPETGYYEIWASSFHEYEEGDYRLEFEVFNDATFVAIDSPDFMSPGQSYTFQVQVRNLGDGTWSEDMLYRLGTLSANPFGPGRFFLGNEVVFPGEDFIFAGAITAPLTPGVYTFNLRMLEEYIEWFGDTLPVTIEVVAATPSPTSSPTPTASPTPGPDAAEFTGLEMPYMAAPGETFPYSVTVRNTGSNIWTNAAGYGLATTYDNCASFPQWIGVPPGVSVPPGSEITFSGLATGPNNPVFFQDRFDTPNSGWTASGLWRHVTAASPYGQFRSSPGAWWFGSPATGDYNDPPGERNYGFLMSPQFAVPAGSTAFVSFFSWEDTEHYDGADSRRLYADDGTNLTLIHDSFLDTARWEFLGPFDITDFAGKTIRLCFEFDTGDDQENGYRGWYIDDVKVSQSPCFADFQMVKVSAPFGPTLQAGVNIDTEFVSDFSYNGGDAGGWYDGLIQGEGQTGVNEFGLCMEVPLLGDNIVGWFSPERYVELKDLTVYRLRIEAHTSQAATDAIPLWHFIYDNYNVNGLGNNYGGEGLFLDVADGANGIDRPQGRSEFDMFVAPNALLTPQWRGLLNDGTVGAFTPAADAANDLRFGVRILDIGSAPINANIDEGVICLRMISVESIPYASLPIEATVWNAPITNNNYAPFANWQAPAFAQIDDTAQRARYVLNTTEDRATLFPAIKPEPYSLERLYPILWETNTLYRTTALVQLAESSTGVDPLDVLFVRNDTATNELGQSHLSLRGAAGDPMFRSAAPRKATVAGGAQPYVGFFYGENRTALPFPGYDRMRPMVDLFNAPHLYGPGTGADMLEIVGLEVSKIRLP